MSKNKEKASSTDKLIQNFIYKYFDLIIEKRTYLCLLNQKELYLKVL